MNDLKEQTALVTGGASGIGLATVELLARRGVTVALNYLPDDPRGPAEIARLQGTGLPVVAAPGDVSRPEAEGLVSAIIARLGRLDMLVNNAGTNATSQPLDIRDLALLDDAFWEKVLSTNVLGPFRCTRAAATALRASRGSLVNVASVAGINMPGSNMAYGASKAALIGLTRNLARALAPEARVNAVAPGAVDTPMTRGWPEARKQAAIERSLLKRLCTAEDIAEVIVFLCTGAAMVTGQTIVVDGGFSL